MKGRIPTAGDICSKLEGYLQDTAPVRTRLGPNGTEIGKPPFVSEKPGNLRDNGIHTLVRGKSSGTVVIGTDMAAYAPFTTRPGIKCSAWVRIAWRKTILDIQRTYHAKIKR